MELMEYPCQKVLDNADQAMKEEFIMELSKELKEKNEQTETKENAAMELTDAELDQVSGGTGGFYPDEEVVHTK